MDRTTDKLILITGKRLSALRTEKTTDIQEAEYYQLLKDQDWYYRVKDAIREARGGSATARQHIYTLLDERIEGQIELTGRDIDRMRMAGAGKMPPVGVEQMTEDDKTFLESCGIKGEMWPL